MPENSESKSNLIGIKAARFKQGQFRASFLDDLMWYLCDIYVI